MRKDIGPHWSIFHLELDPLELMKDNLQKDTMNNQRD